jgi:hypothetical protein
MVPFGIRTDRQSLKVVENLKKGHSFVGKSQNLCLVSG